MNPEISRRGFLTLGGAAFVHTSTENDDELTPWWADCPTSPDYRPLARATAAEGFVVSVSDARTCSRSFIDDDFPVSAPISLPPTLARRELQVVGTARYEMSLVDAGVRPSLLVMFQEPTEVVAYADDSNHGGVIIVALSCSEQTLQGRDDSSASRRTR